MKINWITREKSWAFRYLCQNLINEMPEHVHAMDNDKNMEDSINYICSPNFFKHGISGDGKSILHLDSNRWYEELLK